MPGAVLGMFVTVFADTDEHHDRLWRMTAAAARYGHQQIDQVFALDVDQLTAFNQAVSGLIEKENETGGGFHNKIAEGGG